jgi:hypothetical protein
LVRKKKEIRRNCVVFWVELSLCGKEKGRHGFDQSSSVFMWSCNDNPYRLEQGTV